MSPSGNRPSPTSLEVQVSSSTDWSRLDAALQADTAKLKEALSAVRYVSLSRTRVLVRRYEDEPDYSADVTATLAGCAQGAAKSYRVDFSDSTEMNHVEAAILNRVARPHPAVFAELSAYCRRRSDYCGPIAAFDREIGALPTPRRKAHASGNSFL